MTNLVFREWEQTVMWPSHFCRVRVTMASSQRRFRVIYKFFELSQSRVTRIVESLRLIGLQARVNVESILT